MLYSADQVERANEQKISDYFRSHGYTCQRSGREIHVRGFGGLKIKDDTNEYYIHSQHTGGTGLVSCLMNVLEMPFREAVKEALSGEEPNGEKDIKTSSVSYNRTQKPMVQTAEEKREFIQPKPAADNKRIYAYLHKQRCISYDVINALVNAKSLYQDEKGNAVFLHRKDGIPCGAEFHGTGSKRFYIGNTDYMSITDKHMLSVKPYEAEYLNGNLKEILFSGVVYPEEANIVVNESDVDNFINYLAYHADKIAESKDTLADQAANKLKSFNGVAAGTTDTYFEYDTGDPKKAYVFESAIDMMSFMTLHPNSADCKFVAMAGLKPTVVDKLIEQNLNIVLCVDNDEAGQNFCKRFADKAVFFSECRLHGVKDFNDLLKKQMVKEDFRNVINRINRWAGNVHSIAKDLEVNRGDRTESKEPQYQSRPAVVCAR